MFIETNGIRIRYEVDGRPDRPWLVFSNSLATNVSMWDEQAACFAADYRVLRYDQRGHGLSDAPDGRYDFDMLIADALGLMDALGIERAHFCGLSMGGATAMGLAQRHADRLDRVVVCDSSCASSPASARSWEERIAFAQAQGMAALVEPTIARWFPSATVEADPPHLEKVREMIRTTPVAGFVGCAAALADHDFRTGAERIDRPVLFLAGSEDGATPASMRELQGKVPGSTFVELPGAGHISNLDTPEPFNRAVGAFLQP